MLTDGEKFRLALGWLFDLSCVNTQVKGVQAQRGDTVQGGLRQIDKDKMMIT